MWKGSLSTLLDITLRHGRWVGTRYLAELTLGRITYNRIRQDLLRS